jgi:glutathione S-transferase
MLRIWGRTNSINVQKVLWCCVELDLPFERMDAGMAFGVVQTAAYRALNPNGRIPTLEDDGYVLWESNTIVRYLATKHGLGSLCPSDLGARFDAERWMDWQLTTLDRPVRNVFWALVRTAPEKRDPAALGQAQAEAEHALAILDEHLAQRQFVGGETFTMGDIPVGASVHRWLALDLQRAKHAHVQRWYERLTERPGFREHVIQPLS